MSPRRAGPSCGGASSHRRGARATEGVLERIQRHAVLNGSKDAPRTSASHGSGGGLLRSRSASMEVGRCSTAKSGRGQRAGRRREGRATTTAEIRGPLGRRTNETEQQGPEAIAFTAPSPRTPWIGWGIQKSTSSRHPGCLFDVTARSILPSPDAPLLAG